MGCHGVANYSNVYPTYHVPKLGGQREAYLASALQTYRAGEREHPTMQGQASSLNERDIRDIAAFLAQAPGAAGAKGAAVDDPWVERTAQTCAGCHGQKGVAGIADYPTIAGQYKSYLVHALKAYRDGKRANPIMSAQVQSLTDAQIEALADYYARQPSPLHVPSLTP
jgi:cytochrome c553